MKKIDFHVHTDASFDSPSKIANLLQYAKRRGLDAIVITDHDSIEGYQRAKLVRKASDVEIIPAIEYTLPYGEYGLHLIALYLEEYIPFEDIHSFMKNIKAKNAKIIIPHPYRNGTGLMRHYESKYVSRKELDEVLESATFVEIVNTKDRQEEVLLSINFALKNNFGIVAGTDAHRPYYVGFAYTLVEASNLGSINEDSLRGVVVRSNTINADIKSIVKNLCTGNETHYKGTVVPLKAWSIRDSVKADIEYRHGKKFKIKVNGQKLVTNLVDN